MADYDVERALETIRNPLSSTFGKNLWDPITPEEMRIIEIKYKEAYDSFLESLGYDKPPYRVICDESNNSPEDIENGVVNVTIIPSIERITVEFLLNDKGEGTVL